MITQVKKPLIVKGTIFGEQPLAVKVQGEIKQRTKIVQANQIVKK